MHDDARSQARCTCPHNKLCPRCTPVNYSRQGAKHRRRRGFPDAQAFAPQTTELRPVTR